MKKEWISFTPHSIDSHGAKWREMIILGLAGPGVDRGLSFNEGKREKLCQYIRGFANL